MVRPLLLKRSRRRPLPVKLKLAATLAFLAHGDSIKSKAWEFRIGKSTMYKIVIEVCQAIWTILQPLYLPEPSYELWTQIAENFFSKWQFPNCVGAIDGRHMQIQAPPNSGSEFFNYKKYFSLVLMASCDASYKFTWVDIGQYGSISDGGVWSNSAFADGLEHGEAKLPPPKMLPGSHIKFPYIFVADEAFPLNAYLMRPYPRTALQNKQRVFNYRLSRARRVIENTFGILVSRWRILRRCICNTPRNAEVMFQALVCLHNFIMTEESKETPQHRNYCPSTYVDHEDQNGNTIPGDWRAGGEDERGLQRIGRIGANNLARTAALLRDILCDYLISEAGEEVAPWQYERAFRGAILNLPQF
ncbi:nuclease harbi1-like protein [Lasius niger]|uniref:Nuclease harbi1-like protein n=1 Tax=Lasius niger TaxID=67767 RepID=A0A0J7KDV1_LASNI|nr:nuclease harbi1-like protein [Lasius niger]